MDLVSEATEFGRLGSAFQESSRKGIKSKVLHFKNAGCLHVITKIFVTSFR